MVWLALCLTLGACNTTCSGSLSGNVTVNGGDTAETDASENSGATEISAAASCLNGELAMTHVQEVVSFAPRHVGTEGHGKTRKYIADTLKQMALEPVLQTFTAHTPHPDYAEVEMENISVLFEGESDQRVIISGHFDGKIIETGTFYGANDGGSSTGLLLEMARCLKKHPQKESVELVFFDGEEALLKWTDSDSLYGSKHFVGELMASGENKNIAALVNVDMIGDKRLAYVNERNSTPWVFEALRETATELGYAVLFAGPAASVGDDHIPFIEVKIPAANLIDFRFGPGWQSNEYWHTDQDNMSHISGESIRKTGQIVLSALPKLIAGP